jgi:hypothetical protein
MNQRPSWMPDLRDSWNFFLGKYRDSTAENKEVGRAVTYVLLNTVAFTVSLMVVVILLLLPNRCVVPRVTSLRPDYTSYIFI